MLLSRPFAYDAGLPVSDIPTTENDSHAGPAPGAPATGAPARPRVATLARDLSDFLVEFSIVLHKRALYPSGHPHLQDSAVRFVNRLECLLEHRAELMIGIARHQLIVGGVATDARNALLSDLARRLHRQRIASIRFQRGVALDEIDGFLRNLSGELGEEAAPLGLQLERAAAWRHIQVQAPELGRLLLNEDGEKVQGDVPAGAAEELWVGLANLALSADGQSSPEGADPLIVARAIDDQVGQVAYDRVVLDYLGQMAEEISGRLGAWEPPARERVSRLLSSLRPETLRGLLAAGGDHAERRRFAQTASEVMAVDAVMEVVEAAAATTGQTISTHLLRLLHKFAHHAGESAGEISTEADSILRENVAQLIRNWELADPNPSEYTTILEGMARQTPRPRVLEPETTTCEAELVLQMALETGCTGPRVLAAVDRLAKGGSYGRLTALLAEAPTSGAVDPIWSHLATATRLRDQLKSTSVDFTAVEGVALRLGVEAADPLLDYLETAEDRTSRARAMNVLIAIGPGVLPAADARFAQAPWYVQRNILVLHRALKALPAGFSPISCTVHPHPQVRREAYRLLLAFPQHRTSALSHGLRDADDGIVQMVLLAALESCPREVVKGVERFLGEGQRSAELRGLAVRVLARATGPEVLPRLVGLAGERRVFRGWRLSAKSPIVLAAVNALAQYWSGHPEAASLLALARNHPDPDFRLAAQARLA